MELEAINQSSDLPEAQHFDQSTKLLLLAWKIEQAMKRKHLSRQSFANQMKVQPSIITRWLSGKHNFTVETLFQIEDCLDTKLIAIDLPEVKSLKFHLLINSNPATFSENKEFPGFALPNTIEHQVLDSFDKSTDLIKYLAQLRQDIYEHDKE